MCFRRSHATSLSLSLSLVFLFIQIPLICLAAFGSVCDIISRKIAGKGESVGSFLAYCSVEPNACPPDRVQRGRAHTFCRPISRNKIQQNPPSLCTSCSMRLSTFPSIYVSLISKARNGRNISSRIRLAVSRAVKTLLVIVRPWSAPWSVSIVQLS